jgi:hypothetical protein
MTIPAHFKSGIRLRFVLDMSAAGAIRHCRRAPNPAIRAVPADDSIIVDRQRLDETVAIHDND